MSSSISWTNRTLTTNWSSLRTSLAALSRLTFTSTFFAGSQCPLGEQDDQILVHKDPSVVGPSTCALFHDHGNRRESSRRRLGKVSMGPADPESGMGAIYSSDSLDPLAATEAGRLFDGPLQRVPHRSVASGAGSLLEFCPRHSAGNAETANQGCVSGNACGTRAGGLPTPPGSPPRSRPPL